MGPKKSEKKETKSAKQEEIPKKNAKQEEISKKDVKQEEISKKNSKKEEIPSKNIKQEKISKKNAKKEEEIPSKQKIVEKETEKKAKIEKMEVEQEKEDNDDKMEEEEEEEVKEFYENDVKEEDDEEYIPPDSDLENSDDEEADEEIENVGGRLPHTILTTGCVGLEHPENQSLLTSVLAGFTNYSDNKTKAEILAEKRQRTIKAKVKSEKQKILNNIIAREKFFVKPETWDAAHEAELANTAKMGLVALFNQMVEEKEAEERKAEQAKISEDDDYAVLDKLKFDL